MQNLIKRSGCILTCAVLAFSLFGGFIGGCKAKDGTESEQTLSFNNDMASSVVWPSVNADDLEKEMRMLGESYRPLYEQAGKGSAHNVVLSEGSIQTIVEHFSAEGYTVTGAHRDMENYEPFEAFLEQASLGAEGQASYYYIHSDGGYARVDYYSKDRQLYMTAAALEWDDALNAHVNDLGQYVIDQWQYTDKGYFIYERDVNMSRYALLRVRPLGEENRMLWNTYIRSIGYQGNNLFLTDWDQSSMDQIVFNDLYEYLYLIETGERTELGPTVERIPAEEFEPLFDKYFGVDPEFLRDNALYYEDTNEYFWNYLMCGKHRILFPAPEAEVVDNWRNEDGTITLRVDVVDEHGGNERLFTHEVTIMVQENGSFRYISNRILPQDEENVPDYTPRSEPF